MNHMYRHHSSVGRQRQGSSWVGGAVKVLLVLLVFVGLFILLVRWFRHDGKKPVDKTDDSAGLAAVVTTPAAAAAVNEPATISLQPVNGVAASATATRTHEAGAFTLTLLAQLPAIDNTTEAYEAWYIKPGLTDFFSLGDFYPREDGAWGLVWTVTDALARPDLGEFDKILITREARDGDPAPSTNQILQGEF